MLPYFWDNACGLIPIVVGMVLFVGAAVCGFVNGFGFGVLLVMLDVVLGL